MCAALGAYWLVRNRNADALEWTDRVLGLAGADAHPALCVRVLCIKAWCLWPLGRGDEQPAVTAEAEAIATALADPVLLSQVLETRAMHECAHLGRLDVADRLAADALRWANIAKDDWTIAMAAYARAMAAEGGAELRERVDSAANLLEQVGNLFHVADMLAGVAYSALSQGSDGEAREYLGRAIAVVEGLEHPFLQMLVRGNSAMTSLLTGEIDAARRAFRDELRLCRELVVLPFAHEGLKGLAAIAAAYDDDSDRAARLAGAATAQRYHLPEDAVDARIEATFLEPARIRKGTEAWGEAFQKGAALSFEEAIAFALDETSA